jgi:hypothetical protein
VAGFRMAARIDHGRVQLLTRTGLDWTDKYPSAIPLLARNSFDRPKAKFPAALVATPVDLTRIPVGRPSPVCPRGGRRKPWAAAVGPGQVGDLGDKLRHDPVHTRKNQRRTEPPLGAAAHSEATSC